MKTQVSCIQSKYREVVFGFTEMAAHEGFLRFRKQKHFRIVTVNVNSVAANVLRVNNEMFALNPLLSE